MADFTEALQLDVKDPAAYRGRAIIYLIKGDAAKAGADYDALVKHNPSSPDSFRTRGQFLLDQGKTDAALRDFDEAIRLAPWEAESYVVRARAYRRQRDYARAISDYVDALRINPQYAEAHERLAWTLATATADKVRDGPAALRHAARAAELTEHKDVGALQTLAAASAQAGQFADAVKWQKKALEDKDLKDEPRRLAEQRLRLYEAGKPFRDEAP
jgi:serine/threonine-protein kinase